MSGFAVWDRVRGGLVLSCLLISACLALSMRATEEEEEKTDTVARGRDQETEGLRDNAAGNSDNETDTSAADSRTRAALFPSDWESGTAGEAGARLSS